MSKTRIPKAEITGLFGTIVKSVSKKRLGHVPESLGVMWHNPPGGQATIGREGLRTPQGCAPLPTYIDGASGQLVVQLHQREGGPLSFAKSADAFEPKSREAADALTQDYGSLVRVERQRSVATVATVEPATPLPPGDAAFVSIDERRCANKHYAISELWAWC